MEKKTGGMLVLFTAVVSGFSVFVNKLAVSGADPYLFTFLKNSAVAAFLMCVILGLKEHRVLREFSAKQWGSLALVGLLGGSVPFLLFFRGLQLTDGVTAGFIHKTMFIFVAAFAMIFLKERVTKGMIAAGALLLAGNALLLGLSQASIGLGALMVLAATVLWSAENVFSKHVLKTMEGIHVAFGRMLFGSLFILLFLAVTGSISGIAALSASQWHWTALTSLFLLLYVASWYTGLKHIKVTTASAVLMLGSVITTSLSYAFLDAQLTTLQAAGMLMLLSGVLLAAALSDIADSIKVFLPWSARR
ncbi:EamA family transporter [Candidatus Woesearchaeota archaeon]|nr:EamA family transporter [Candidatus Woesearchaeota archaeon]